MGKYRKPKILSGVALEPGKFYILNIHGVEHMPREELATISKHIQKYLAEHNIHGILVPSPVRISSVTEVSQSELLQIEGANVK